MNDPKELNIEHVREKIQQEVGKRKAAITQTVTQNTLHPNPADTPQNTFPASTQKTCSVGDFQKYDDASFIKNAFQKILKRDPDPGGFEAYLAGLRQGMSKSEILWRLRYSREGRQQKVAVKGLFIRRLVGGLFKIPVIGYFINCATSIVRFPKTLQSLRQHIASTNVHFTQYHETISSLSARLDAEAVRTQNMLADKADAGSVHEIRRYLSSKVDGQIIEQLYQLLAAKADAAAIDRLKGMIETKADSEQLHQLLATKADSTTIENLKRIIEAKADSEDLAEIITALDNKADSEQIHRLLESKADTAAVMDMNTILSIKADTAINSLKKDIEDGNADSEQLYRLLETKADTTIAENLKRIIEAKANSEDLAAVITLLDSKADSEQLQQLLEATADSEARLHEENHFLDAFYVAFEDRFRGTREDIKEKLKAYLPYIKKILPQPGSGRILDVGCGRGEWLELLKEMNYPALGIDRNRVMIEQCNALSLDVLESDAIAYMREQKSGCLDVVTGFQVIEHLVYKTLIDLFDESLRLLRPGGMILFETPNPENLIVAACNFYYDFTHVRPIAPPPLKFLIEQRGFVDVEILRMHPYAEFQNLQVEGGSGEQIKNLFASAQDYAAIARKPQSK